MHVVTASHNMESSYICFLLLVSQIITSLVAENNTNLSTTVLEVRSPKLVLGVKIKMTAWLVPSGDSTRPFPCLFQLLKVARHSAFPGLWLHRSNLCFHFYVSRSVIKSPLSPS